MTDLEITRLCAEAMDWKTKIVEPHGLYVQRDAIPKPDWFHYQPLYDDAQAIAPQSWMEPKRATTWTPPN